MAPKAEKKPAEEKPASEKPVEEKAPAEKKPKAGRKLPEEAGAGVDKKKKMKKISIETCQKTLEIESMAPEAEKKPASEKPVEEKSEAEEADPVPEWIRTYEAQELQLKENPYWELITDSSDKKLIGKYRRKAVEEKSNAEEADPVPEWIRTYEAQELQLKENPYWELITEPSDMNVGKWRPRQSPNSPDPELLS